MNLSELPRWPPRPPDAHKGSMGRALLIAGSRGMAGAASLSAEAALRTGAGYLVAAVPGNLALALSIRVPAAVLALQGDDRRESLEAGDWPALQAEFHRADAVAIGPGLGLRPATQAFFAAALADMMAAAKPLVIDADGLNLLAMLGFGKQPNSVSDARLPTNTVLSPHPGEAARILAWPHGEAVQQDRDRAAKELVNRTGACIVLKGAPTLVAAPNRKTWINSSGNPGLATAGSGDVLTGILAGLLARGLSSWDAARLAVFVHGRSADLAAAELGEEAMLASDLARFLAPAIAECCSNSFPA
ncbi:MAG: NAD(P)H-hydrate dehydratase [Planctomycetota bacterium]|nr:MAG: NAD(P)H-hydrate dehydratase [Planctomycetota bacterium]